MSRAEYVWGAKQYLASYEKGEKRVYDEWRMKFPWRSLASIGARLGREYGMKFKFFTDKITGEKIIYREI